MSGQVALAWLSNATLAFVISALIVLPAIRFLRPAPSVRLCLSLLPFARLALDLCSGVPNGVHVWYGLKGDFLEQVVLLLGHEGRPCSAPALYCFGSSSKAFGHYPTRLVAGVKANVEGQWYPLGVGDILAKLLDHWVQDLSLLLVATVVGVASVKAGRRLVGAWSFEQARRTLRGSARSRTIAKERLWVRSVDIYLSDAHDGSPFTGGLFRPYVCFPLHTFKSMGSSERRAALSHELAHVRRLDALLIVSLGLAHDIFWFVPLMSAARHQVLHSVELAADAISARSSGSVVMASAILRVGESLKSQPAADGHGLGVMSDRSRLADRIEALMAPKSRRRSLSLMPELAITAIVAFITLTSAFLGYR